ncbi:MAG: hypothetical protein ACI9S8_000145 [Chlamydiales bacterium]|jgi:hypothetical protein
MIGKVGDKTLHLGFSDELCQKPKSNSSIISKYKGNLWKQVSDKSKLKPEASPEKCAVSFYDKLEFTAASTSLVRRVYDYAKTLFSSKTPDSETTLLDRGIEATRLLSVLSLPNQIKQFVINTQDEYQEVRAYGVEKLPDATLKTVVGASGIIFSAANGITGIKKGVGLDVPVDTSYVGPVFMLYQAISVYETAKIVQKYYRSRKVLNVIDNSSELYQKVLSGRIKKLEKRITDDPDKLERSCAFAKSSLMESASKVVLRNLVDEMKTYRSMKINQSIDKLIKLDNISLKKRQQIAVLDTKLMEVKGLQIKLKKDTAQVDKELNKLIEEIPFDDRTRIMRNLMAKDSEVPSAEVSANDLKKILKKFLKTRHDARSKVLKTEKKALLQAIRCVRKHRVEAAKEKVFIFNSKEHPKFKSAWDRAISENVSHRDIAEAMKSARKGKNLNKNEKLLGKYGFKVKNLGVILEDENLSELELEEALEKFDSPGGAKKASTLVSKLHETAAKKTWKHKFSVICRGLGLAAFGAVLTFSSWVGGIISGGLWMIKESIQYYARYGKSEVGKGLNAGEPERAVEQEDVAAIRDMLT